MLLRRPGRGGDCLAPREDSVSVKKTYGIDQRSAVAANIWTFGCWAALPQRLMAERSQLFVTTSFAVVRTMYAPSVHGLKATDMPPITRQLGVA
jgi:hypothetical protein